MKTRKILIVALLLMSFSFIKCECAGDSACQITYVEGVNRVVCAGECPSAEAPECYVRFRKAGSTDEWTRFGPFIGRTRFSESYITFRGIS